MAWPAYSCLEIVPEEPVVVVRINRPEAANALNRAAAAALKDAVERVNRSESLRAMVLTGKGDRAFCAGADLKERREWRGREYEARRPLVELWRVMDALSKPLVMAVNGHAVGGGFEMLFLADAVIASEQAHMWLPEVGWGGGAAGAAGQIRQ
ncbi:MAG: enoyl-CoA hydratase/isomerase family protein [Firmicutes bacterium]|nr:enoyl-CoA hydratase/isomerase family protein [Bacillota bacterium]